MASVESVRLKEPAHPGGFAKSEIIEALGLSVTEGAQALGVTRPALSARLFPRNSLSITRAYR